MPHRLVRTADGFRGTFLFLVALMFLPISVAFALDSRPLWALSPGLGWIPDEVRVWHLGIVFAASLLAAVSIGLFSRRLSRWPNVIGWGYVAALVPPVLATILPLWGLFNGAPLGLLWQSIWPNLILSAVIYLGSEWPNPQPLPPRLPPSAPTPGGP